MDVRLFRNFKLQGIAVIKKLKGGLQVMVAIFSTASDMQKQIDFGW
jgi:hypothetical protein